MLLDRQNSPYSQLLATTTLTKLISRTAQVLSLQQRIDIRKNFLIFKYKGESLLIKLDQLYVTYFSLHL